MLSESTYGIDTRPPAARAPPPAASPVAAETSSCEIGSRATPPRVQTNQPNTSHEFKSNVAATPETTSVTELN